MPAAVLLGGDQPWPRRLLGISVAPQVGSIFNEAGQDNMARRWNGVTARGTTQLGATNHRPYQMTRKSLDAARCTDEPLLVIAKNRGFVCILDCCMAFGRLFVAFLEARVGNHEAAVLRAQVGVHPQVGIHLGGGCMTRGRRPRRRGPSRASPSPAPTGPLAGKPRPRAPPLSPRATPRAPLPAQLRISGPPWAPWAP